MKVTIDSKSGFCFGVVYAIEMAEEISFDSISKKLRQVKVYGGTENPDIIILARFDEDRLQDFLVESGAAKDGSFMGKSFSFGWGQLYMDAALEINKNVSKP